MADAPARPHQPLDDVMLAMDVVDTLRHRQVLVAEELQGPERDEALVARLKGIYAAQGIEVAERTLREGVAALREDRFAYRPPPDTPAVRWARVYAQRRLWARRALLVAVALLVAYGAFWATTVAPREGLLTRIAGSEGAVAEIVRDDAAASEATVLALRARTAAQAGDLVAARAELERLEALQARLERSYTLVIAFGQNVVSGVWRVPEGRDATRTYYLIVDAVDDRGRAVTLPIRNEETGQVERVSTFGLRVDEATWDRVAADLDDDGIIQERVVAIKRPGELEPEYLVGTTGGTITRW
jgi:hypothetical protein